MNKYKFMSIFIFIVFLGIAVPGLAIYENKYKNYYEEIAIQKYKFSESYPYISRFLIPYLFPELENVKNQKILDAGCGVGLWAIYAAQNGAKVTGIDIQPGMIALAKKNIKDSDLTIDYKIGDASNLQEKENYFDKTLSINVACNLDKKSFENHFKELARVTKEHGTIIVIAPISHNVIFSDDSINTKILKKKIFSSLKQAQKYNIKTSEIPKILNTFKGIHSATFSLKNGKLHLVTKFDTLIDGQRIWRKLTDISIPNRFYSKKAYFNAIKKADLKINKVIYPHFSSETERIMYNRDNKNNKLGPEYVDSSPFIIFYLTKVKS